MKKLFYIGGAFLAIVCMLILAYKLLETPKTQLTQAKAVESDSHITLRNLKQHMSEYPQETVFFVRKDDDTNAEFMESSLLVELSSEYENSALPDIKVIDLDDNNLSVTRLKSQLGIKQIPALIILKGNEKGYDIISSIESQSDNPLTVDQIRTWLFENNQWFGPYGAQ